MEYIFHILCENNNKFKTFTLIFLINMLILIGLNILKVNKRIKSMTKFTALHKELREAKSNLIYY